MYYLILRETNALTKRILAGTLSKAAQIRAGKDGAIRSQRKMLTGFMKGNKKLSDKHGITFKKIEGETSSATGLDKVVNIGNKKFNKKSVRSLVIRHEIDEVIMSKLLAKELNRNILHFDISIAGHISSEVLRRERNCLQLFKMIHPNSRNYKYIKNELEKWRIKSLEYEHTLHLKSMKQSLKFDKKVINDPKIMTRGMSEDIRKKFNQYEFKRTFPKYLEILHPHPAP